MSIKGQFMTGFFIIYQFYLWPLSKINVLQAQIAEIQNYLAADS